jgi:hypothetical protein
VFESRRGHHHSFPPKLRHVRMKANRRAQGDGAEQRRRSRTLTPALAGGSRDAQVKRQQPRDAHEPCLPHAPGKSAHQGEGRKGPRGEWLRSCRQVKDQHDHGSARDGEQNRSQHTELVDRVQKNVVGVVGGASRSNEPFGSVGRSGGLLSCRQCCGRLHTDAEQRMGKRLLRRRLPQDDPVPGRHWQPFREVKSALIGDEACWNDQHKSRAPNHSESADDGLRPSAPSRHYNKSRTDQRHLRRCVLRKATAAASAAKKAVVATVRRTPSSASRASNPGQR